MPDALLLKETSNEKDREKLIAILIAAYAFRKTDVARLASILAQAYLAAMQRAARRAEQTVGAAPTWEPSGNLEHWASQQAEVAAEAIAVTFSSLLEGFLQRSGEMLVDLRQTLTGIVEWFHQMLRWKVPQIVNVTCSSGATQGTGAIVQELLAGDLIDADEPDVVIGSSDYEIEVQPATASNDICADYAGKRFPLKEWDSLPDWPVHPNCPHQNVLVEVE